MNKFLITVIIASIILTTSSFQFFAQSAGQPTSVTLKVSVISPQDGVTLTHFPTKLEVKVTRGGFPIEGARVQFWMQGGSHDADMHNAFLTKSDSSGLAYLTLQNPNTLDEGQFIWYADAILPGFRGGASQVISFYNSFSSNKASISGGNVSTDQKEYSLGNGVDISISGNVNNYHLGEPVIIKITSPSGKIDGLYPVVSYLGAFQTPYNLGQNSKLGIYNVIVYHKYTVSSTSTFHVVK
ncbi:MAG: hypothetical protein KGI28_02620 [Thaumarchaeota archaeon]|nr:hypothetical protein [Nitrososphaerota archaeon]